MISRCMLVSVAEQVGVVLHCQHTVSSHHQVTSKTPSNGYRWGDSSPVLHAFPKEKVFRDVAHMTSSTVRLVNYTV